MVDNETLQKMDAASLEAQKELLVLVAKHTEAAKAFGEWASKHKAASGYKRLAKLIVGLGE